MFSGCYRRPKWYEVVFVIVLALFSSIEEGLPLFVFMLVILGLAGLRILRLPNLLDGEQIIDYKSASLFLKHKTDSQGRVRLSLFQFALAQFPLFNLLFGAISYGSFYVTTQRLIFDKYPGYILLFNRGKSFTVDVKEIREIHEPKFAGGLNIKNEIVRFSRGRVDPESAETIVDFVGLIPYSSLILSPFTLYPRFVVTIAKLNGMGFAGIVDDKGLYLLWLKKPESILENLTAPHINNA